jgi:hypothetical protein
MRGKMRLLVAPALAVLMSGIVAPTGRAQSQPPSVQRLFEQALEAKGDEYIELRNQIAGRKEAVSFLKAKLSDQDWKAAIIAEAILGRIKQPETYRHYEELLIVPIKAAHGFAHDWMTRKRPDPFERIRGMAPCDTTNDALLTGQYLVGSGYRRPESTPQTNSQLALHQEDAVPFLVELALKEITVELPGFASGIPLADDANSYSVHAVAALLNVTAETVERWCKARPVMSLRPKRRDCPPRSC